MDRVKSLLHKYWPEFKKYRDERFFYLWRAFFHGKYIDDFFDKYRNNIEYMWIFDLDHFKSLNDVFSHSFWDEVISNFAYNLSKNFFVVRYWWEEFVVFSFDVNNLNNLSNYFDILIEDIEKFGFNNVVVDILRDFHDRNIPYQKWKLYVKNNFMYSVSSWLNRLYFYDKNGSRYSWFIWLEGWKFFLRYTFTWGVAFKSYFLNNKKFRDVFLTLDDKLLELKRSGKRWKIIINN